MTSSKPPAELDASWIGSSRDALEVARLVVLIAVGDEERCRRIAQSARELGARDVTEVYSLAAALEQLGRQTPDILLCGEQLRDQQGILLLEAALRISPATLSHLLPDDEGPDGSDPERVEASNRTAMNLLLKEALHHAVAPRGGFWCRVPNLTLADILQMYHQLRRSITVLVSGRIAGHIRLELGELVHAESGDQLGEAALCRLLESEPGLVRTDTTFDGPVTISAPFHQVLFDAMAQLDTRRQAAFGESPVETDQTDETEADARAPTALPAAEADLDERLLYEPRPEAPIELPDATSFETDSSWQRARKALLVVAGGSAAAVSLYVLVTDGAGRADTPAPALAVSVQRSTAVGVEEPASAPAQSEGEVSRFALRISSTPSGATVLEAGTKVGTTPLTVLCDRSSMAGGPRRFVLSSAGYVPQTLVQAMSDVDVHVDAVLLPIHPAKPASPSRAADTPAAPAPELRLQR